MLRKMSLFCCPFCISSSCGRGIGLQPLCLPDQSVVASVIVRLGV